MFDTVALFRITPRKPVIPVGVSTIEHPWKTIIKVEKRMHQPRLTITRQQTGKYITRAEVSVPAWLFGSNSFLPSVTDIPIFFDRLDEFVGQRTGLHFNSRSASVSRLDLCRDYECDPTRIVKIIDNYRMYNYPKRRTELIGGTTVRFAARSKQLVVYSKFHEVSARSEGSDHVLPLIRMEDRHRTAAAVTSLCKSIGLHDRSAERLLSQDVSAAVMDKLETRLGIVEAIANSPGNPIKSLFETVGAKKARPLVLHRMLETYVGQDYFIHQEFRVSSRTARRRSREAAKLGLFSLE